VTSKLTFESILDFFLRISRKWFRCTHKTALFSFSWLSSWLLRVHMNSFWEFLESGVDLLKRQLYFILVTIQLTFESSFEFFWERVFKSQLERGSTFEVHLLKLNFWKSQKWAFHQAQLPTHRSHITNSQKSARVWITYGKWPQISLLRMFCRNDYPLIITKRFTKHITNSQKSARVWITYRKWPQI